MTGWWSRAPIRVRLTVWYTAVLALLLIVYATVTFLAVRHEFDEQLAEESRNDPEHAAFTPEDWVEHQVEEVLIVLVSGLPIVIGLAGLAGYALARRALVPIDHLAADARRITADRLHQRLAVPNQHDEIGRLAAVFNETLARLETSFEQLRRFTADASHELRTPLAVIRGIGELRLRDARGAPEDQDAIGSMLEEVDRLTRLVDTLLRLSRGDAGTVKLSPESINLADLAREVSSSLQVLAEERGQRIELDLRAEVSVHIDRLVLREAVTNLVDNAIKYSGAGSTITILVDVIGQQAQLAVKDGGAGIPAGHRDRIFDRFYRIDEGRSREMGGTGLGLAIAKWAVEANGGQLSLDSGDAGSTFTVTLPLDTSRSKR
jgi:heavy metal sensor kinase